MLRTQNITGPTNGNTNGYNSSVNAINVMQREEIKLLDSAYSEQNSKYLEFMSAYNDYTTQYNLVARLIDFVDVLIRNF